MNNTVVQICLALAMFLITAVAGFIPIQMIKKMTAKGGESKKSQKRLSYLSCFSGGVFLATCFLDIVPHINESYSKWIHESGISDEFPLPQFFTCIGFFLVYFIEELCIKIFAMPHAHSHGGEHTPSDKESGDVKMPPPPVRRESYFNGENIHEGDSMLSPHRDMASSVGMTSIHDIVVEETVKYATSDPKNGSLLKSLTFAVAISFHSILEGFALGVQDTPSRIVTLFLSLLLHKGIEAFSVGLQISRGNTNRMKVLVFTIFIYALMTPIGSALGTVLQSSTFDPVYKDGTIILLESLAAGTFIYVTFLEVLAHEKTNDFNSLKQLFSIFVGFAAITALQYIFGGHEHGGGSSEEHNHVHVGH